MKPIDINLSTTERIDIVRDFYLPICALGFVFILIIFNIYSGVNSYNEKKFFEKKFKQLEVDIRLKNQSSKSAADKFDAAAFDQLQRNINTVNQIISQDIFPWSYLFFILESSLPDDVLVRELRASETFDRLYIIGRTKSLGKISRFVKKLEKADAFTSSKLLKLTVNDSDNKEFLNSNVQNNQNMDEGIEFEVEMKINLKKLSPILDKLSIDTKTDS